MYKFYFRICLAYSVRYEVRTYLCINVERIASIPLKKEYNHSKKHLQTNDKKLFVTRSRISDILFEVSFDLEDLEVGKMLGRGQLANAHLIINLSSKW